MITPIILAGGNGTRLWPLSRAAYPKQFLPLTSEHTLLQATALRCSNERFKPLTVICNNEHRFLVAEQLQAIAISPKNLVLESAAKNTAPAILVGCLLQDDPEALILILPADHKIDLVAEFYRAIELATCCALQGHIVTFGIKPNSAEIHYGYIQKGAILPQYEGLYKISSFIEKPDLATAEQFLTNDPDHYYWNSGIILCKASTILTEVAHFAPDLLLNCQNAVAAAVRDLDFLRVDLSEIPDHKFNSIDYIVMEKTQKAVVLPVNFTWSDLGSWNALWQALPKDQQGNVVDGDLVLHQVNNSYIRSESQLLVVAGVDDLIIVATKDAILISSKARLTELTTIMPQLIAKDRYELKQHLKVYRPWGHYQIIDRAARSQVKSIMLKPGAKTSTQIHYHRAEHWVVVQGTAKVVKGDQTLLLQENESIYLPLGIKHRLENPGKIPLYVIEVQSGAYLEEDDIIRLEDDYGR